MKNMNFMMRWVAGGALSVMLAGTASAEVKFEFLYQDVVSNLNKGFNDATVTNVSYSTNTTLGAIRREASESAARMLGQLFYHSATVRVVTSSTAIPGNLGACGSEAYGGAVTGFFPSVMAQTLLTGVDAIPTNEFHVDLSMNFVGADDSGWDYSDAPESSKTDYKDTLIHELTHALGMLNAIGPGGGDYPIGGGLLTNVPDFGPEKWYVWDRFLTDQQTNALIDEATCQFKSNMFWHLTNDICFNGPYAKMGNNGELVQIYAPTNWSGGSSGCHPNTNYPYRDVMYYTGILGGLGGRWYSPAEAGILKDLGYDLIDKSAPTNVAASDGAYADKVRVTWSAPISNPAMSNVVGYVIYRSTSNAPLSATVLPGAEDLTNSAVSFDDTNAVASTVYYYWVCAKYNFHVPQTSLRLRAVSGYAGAAPAVADALWLGGTDNNWSTDANWTNATAPLSGATVLFYGAPGTYRDIQVGEERMVNQLVFTHADQPVTLRNGMLTLTNKASFFGTGIVVEANSAHHEISAHVKLKDGGGHFLINSGSTFTVSGQITNEGAVELVKRGEGTLILSGNNPYGLDTNQYGFGVGVMGGTLVVGSNENLGLPYHHVFMNNAATLRFTHATEVARPFWMDGEGILSVDAGKDVYLNAAYNGVPALNGGGMLTKAGVGRLVVGGVVTMPSTAYRGNIQVAAGEFQMNREHTGLGDVYIDSNATFAGIGIIGQATNTRIVMVHPGAKLKPGTHVEPGTLTFTNAINGSSDVRLGGMLEVNISSNATALLEVKGLLALGAESALQINLLATTLDAITHTIATADVLTGTFAVTNGVPYGHAVSYSATSILLIPVPVAPRITVQPVSLTNTAGEMAIFSVIAEGSSPLAYQWQKDLADLGGMTHHSLVIATPTVADSGSYRCIVTNAYGAVTSAVAVLVVNEAPTPTPTVTATPTATGVPPTSTPTATPSVTATPSPTATPLGYANVGVYQPLSGNWYVLQASTMQSVVTVLGGPGYYPVAADYDGDRYTDIAVYNLANGLWYVLQSGGGGLATAPFGGGGFMPIPMDYDGDAKADPAVYLEANGAWAVMMSGSSYAPVSTLFGGLGYEAVPADYDGDAKADPAVYTAEAGRWTVMLSGAGYRVLSASFGGTGLAAAEADYDGDGKTDPTVYANGYWYSMMSAQGYTMQIRSFGGAEYAALPGDYDGDRIDDLAVYNAAAGQWYILPSMPGSSAISLTFGGATFMPVGVVR